MTTSHNAEQKWKSLADCSVKMLLHVLLKTTCAQSSDFYPENENNLWISG